MSDYNEGYIVGKVRLVEVRGRGQGLYHRSASLEHRDKPDHAVVCPTRRRDRLR